MRNLSLSSKKKVVFYMSKKETSHIAVTELTDEYYNGFEFSTDMCTLLFLKSDEYQNAFVLDSFMCDEKTTKGEGRILLMYALKYIHNRYIDELPANRINTIILESVPHTEKYKKAGLSKVQAQKKLNDYYTHLGFTQTSPNSNLFEGNIQKIIEEM